MPESSLPEPKPRFRFAPSPNGRLHKGHALSALLNQQLARERGGTFLIRIEDIDVTRCPAAFCKVALDDLAWMGVSSDEPVLCQSTRAHAYGKALDRLKRLGVIYPCTCTRSQIASKVAQAEMADQSWPRDPDGAPLYPGTCRGRDVEKPGKGPFNWRLDVAKALSLPEVADASLFFIVEDEHGSLSQRFAQPSRWGDVVLGRRDIGTSYHLSVVIDDAFQAITHVVRGRDLEAATDIHVLLQRLLGLTVPIYRFHGLIYDEGGDKLAKSRGSTSLDDLRRAGVTVEALRRELGF
ncbi:MAG: tRNA glutamyl-Q(34) synthetase GluQRS [Bosea sp. (in: a-proteobacteria)]